MELLIEYLNNGHSFSELLTTIIVIAGVIICIEKLFKWLYDLFIKLYKKKKGQEDEIATLDKNTNEIKNLADNINNLADLLNKQYQHLDKKIDEQKERITKIDEDGKKRDCALLRDRILQSTKYFIKNHIVDGNVHINITEWENINAMFEEYFKAHGNGAVKKIYDEEFSKWIIDND